MTTNQNPADAVREALEVMETRWGGYATAKETIRQHIDSLESRLAALAGAAPVQWQYRARDAADVMSKTWHNTNMTPNPRLLDRYEFRPLFTHAPAKAREDEI